MESIEKHIEEDKKILENPTTSPQQRRHIEGELEELELYSKRIIKKKLRQEIIMIPLHLSCFVRSNQTQMSVEFTKTEYGTGSII